jgi:hypothetical protein
MTPEETAAWIAFWASLLAEYEALGRELEERA